MRYVSGPEEAPFVNWLNKKSVTALNYILVIKFIEQSHPRVNEKYSVPLHPFPLLSSYRNQPLALAPKLPVK